MTSLRSPVLLAICVFVLATPGVTESVSGFTPPHRWHPTSAVAVHPTRPAPEFEWRLALGCGAVAMLVLSRLHEPKYPQFYYLSVVSAAVCCWYGFDSGAWPLGIGLSAYTIRILIKRPRKHIRVVYDNPEYPARARFQWHEPTRLARLFGNK